MINRIIKILTILTGVLLWGCYPQGVEFAEDTDVVVTKHNEKYNFNTKSTYAMPDQIIDVNDSLAEGQLPEFMSETYANKILARIASNMSSSGYQKVDINANPDLILFPASWQETTIYYQYWIFWMGSGYPYLGYPVEDEYDYTTGTLLMIIFDPNELDDTGKPINQWTGAINGLMTGTYSDTRVNKSIDQAFVQSPYLTAN